jgi:hypothetical protein
MSEGAQLLLAPLSLSPERQADPPGRLKADRAEPRALRHGFGPTLRVEFVEQRSDVKLHRVNRDREAACNRLVRRPVGDQRQHIEFARR